MNSFALLVRFIVLSRCDALEGMFTDLSCTSQPSTSYSTSLTILRTCDQVSDKRAVVF